MITFYCGQCGLSLQDFYKSSWEYLACIGNGYGEKQKDEWRRTREVVAMIYNVNAKHKKKSSELIPLQGERKMTQVNMTEQDAKRLIEFYENAKRAKSKHNG